MESYALPIPAYPPELSEISMALFTDLQDAAGLRLRLIKASTLEGDEGVQERKNVDFAFLDGKMVSVSVCIQSSGMRKVARTVLFSIRRYISLTTPNVCASYKTTADVYNLFRLHHASIS